jgi:hypothetical protein
MNDAPPLQCLLDEPIVHDLTIAYMLFLPETCDESLQVRKWTDAASVC